MKKFLVMLIFLAITSAGMSQNPAKGLFRPAKDILSTKIVGGILQSPNISWLLRLSTDVGLTQNTYDRVDKVIKTKFAQFLGFGLGLQHYTILNDGTPFNNYGVNLLFLTPTVDGGGMGVGLFGNFSIISAGVDYNFLLKQFSVDTGVILKF